MPESSAESKGTHKPQGETDGRESYKLSRETSRGEGRDSKRESFGDASWNADAKEGQHQHPGNGRGKLLSSLPKATSPRPSETPAFSSLPSPSADSGKLAPLALGQRSPRSQPSPRPSLRSNSPRALREQTSERASLSLPPSDSGSPRSLSPRLPPMKSPPVSSAGASNDDSSLPGLCPSPRSRSGAHSARRVRSLPPNSKRASCADPARTGLAPAGGAGGSDGRFSPLLGANEREPRRGQSDPAVEGSSRKRSDRDRDGDRNGGGEVAEAKDRSDLSEVGQNRPPMMTTGSKSISPIRDRGEGSRRSSGRLPPGVSPTPSPSPSPSPSPNNDRVKRNSRPSIEGLASASHGGEALPPGDTRKDGHRHHLRSEEKDGSSMPNSPSTARGEESSQSPRTRRMRPQRDSAV